MCWCCVTPYARVRARLGSCRRPGPCSSSTPRGDPSDPGDAGDAGDVGIGDSA